MEEQQPLQEKKINIWLPFLLSMMMVGGMLVGSKLNQKEPATKIVIENNDGQNLIGQGRIEELIRYIEAKYVDKIDGEDLVEEAIIALLGDLDPHSVYMTSEQVREADEQLEGSFVGIGIEYLLLGDTIAVLEAIEDGPAKEAGLRSGDRIVAVYDATLSNDSLAMIDVVKKLRGKKGSDVDVGVLRRGSKEIKRINIRRDRIPIHSVDTHYMLTDKTGYVKVNKFSSTTFDEFMDAVDDMVINNKMEHLVIDLRQNGGGYLNEAIKMLNQIFKEQNKMLVYTEGRSVKRDEYHSAGKIIHPIDKVVILIDENSASASEIVAGAIQDWDRGLVIGRRSYGKGLVQEQYKLKDGSALRLTVARYYTPSGRSIQREYKDNERYHQYVSDRLDSGELTGENVATQVDSSIFYTSGGREVFSGGGISPDIFIPIDSALLNEKFNKIINRINPFIFRYIESHDIDLKPDSFLEKFVISDDMWDAFGRSLKAEEIDLDLNENLEKEVKQRLKSRLARHLLKDEMFYRTINHNDKMILKTLEEINDNPLLSKN